MQVIGAHTLRKAGPSISKSSISAPLSATQDVTSKHTEERSKNTPTTSSCKPPSLSHSPERTQRSFPPSNSTSTDPSPLLKTITSDIDTFISSIATSGYLLAPESSTIAARLTALEFHEHILSPISESKECPGGCKPMCLTYSLPSPDVDGDGDADADGNGDVPPEVKRETKPLLDLDKLLGNRIHSSIDFDQRNIDLAMADAEAKPEKEKTKLWKEPAHFQPLLQGIKNAHSSHDHSDLVIRCKDREWKVHRLVVCSQSEPIDKAVRDFKEGEDGVYSMKEQDPQVVEALIRYLYTFEYGDDGNGQGDVAGIVFDVRVFIVADKYFVKPLCQLAAKKFEERCKSEWASADFAKALSELYENGADYELFKTIAVSTIKDHASQIFDAERGAEFAPLNEVLRNTELGADVSQQLALGVEPGTVYKCPNCQKVFSVQADPGCCFSCPKGHYIGGSYNMSWWLPYAVKDTK
ncbi:putative BTB/POZ domain-containing protein [Septoria linicola]|nr:putative BTB/POZ domain-containing protein [Septoria linicola]